MEGNPPPTRVVVNASKKGEHWTKAWESPEVVIETALGLLKDSNLVPLRPGTKPRFLVKERFDARTFVVFDLSYDHYDPDTAHEDQTELPVLIVYLGEKQNVYCAAGGMSRIINRMVREVHNDTGLGSRPPFSVDHADGNVPRYHKPRTSTPPS